MLKRSPIQVFVCVVTAYDKYAVAAFEQQAADHTLDAVFPRAIYKFLFRQM